MLSAWQGSPVFTPVFTSQLASTPSASQLPHNVFNWFPSG